MYKVSAYSVGAILARWRDRMRRHRDPLRCAYEDDVCPGQHPVALDENDGDPVTERVTCPHCREYLGLPSCEEA